MVTVPNVPVVTVPNVPVVTVTNVLVVTVTNVLVVTVTNVLVVTVTNVPGFAGAHAWARIGSPAEPGSMRMERSEAREPGFAGDPMRAQA